MRLLRLLAAVAVTALVVVLGSAAAEAKGPSTATIEGPGIAAPIEVNRADSRMIGADLAMLVKDSKILSGLWCPRCDDRLRQPPTDRLGPRYTVTYTMALEGDLQASTDTVVQYVYPFAVPHPVVYIPAHQPFWNTDTVGGWFVARPRLRTLLTVSACPMRRMRRSPPPLHPTR